MNRVTPWFSSAFTAVLAVGLALPAAADPVADFYRGRTTQIVASFPAGGMYSVYSLLLANHMGRHIPGTPTVIVQHMPGAGGLKATNYLYNAAARDGTVMGMVVKDLAVDQVLRPKVVKYDAAKFNWLGRVNAYVSVLYVTDRSGARTIEDAKKKEVILGSSGKTSGTYVHPILLNRLAGTKFRIVLGYKGAADLNQAAENGETHGWANGAYVGFLRPGNRRDMLKAGKVSMLMLTGTRRRPEAPDVPLFLDLVKDPEARKIVAFVDSVTELGWALFTTPGVPPERVAALRTAFDATVRDPAFLADAKRIHAPIDPLSAAEVTKIVKDTLAVSPDVVRKMRDLVGF